MRPFYIMPRQIMPYIAKRNKQSYNTKKVQKRTMYSFRRPPSNDDIYFVSILGIIVMVYNGQKSDPPPSITSG